MNRNFILKGTFCDCGADRALRIREGYGVCEGGVCRGIYADIPEKYAGLPVRDCTGMLILPGLVDLHVHAPQYGFRGVGLDRELLDWLNNYTFPEESRYADAGYAREAYAIFVDDLRRSATTRAAIFATIHTDATLELMAQMEVTGLITRVGKLNMDRNAPDYYIEESAEASLAETVRFIEESRSRFTRTQPIITPRFIPTASDELMRSLGELKRRYGLGAQSHLSENGGEIRWVAELCPWAKNYGDAYDQPGLLGPDVIMAHCIHGDADETALLKDRGVFVAHCPRSNMNVISGLAPIRMYLERGMNVGIGSDVAGGDSLSLFEEMAEAVRASKMRWQYVDREYGPLTVADALYMATRGGGAYFGKTGCFDEGYEFDAVVMDDSGIKSGMTLTDEARIERLIYLSGRCALRAKFCAGREIDVK